VIRALLLIVLLCGPALAVQPDELLADPALESRAREISAGLRCLVCQNQSIDDSDAPLARDLRLLVRERLQAGDSDAEVRGYLVSRYGDFILLRPPFEISTLILWFTPIAVLLLGALMAFARFRRAPADVAVLTPAEEAALSRIMQEEPPATLPKFKGPDTAP
jgi:cytochrome c-type biogenesis protein CcmH